MQVHDLKVIHRIKDGPQDSLRLRSPHLFHLDTCQRQLWITEGRSSAVAELQGAAVFTGEAAYEQLLSVACGLESRVVGETEVYSQIRKAWRTQRINAPIDGLLTKLFEDTKFIRSNFLTGIGGQSYGTLIRKHLKPADHSHFLIVGAGELAAAVAPMLTDWRLTFTNRSLPKAERLAATIRKRGATADVSHQPETLASITHSIICRPFDRDADQQVLNLPGLTSFIHLGASADEMSSVSTPLSVSASSLNDVFALQEIYDEVRMSRVTRARRACRDRAQLRNLGPSVSLPHGWEDLAAFSVF
jgi:hypothetical protein